MPEAEHSTLGPIGIIIAQAIEDGGQDAAGLFAEVGLDLDALREPHVRIPAAAMESLLTLIPERLDDPIFGLRLANYVHPTSFYSLGIAMCFSETLEDFMECYVKYYRLITTNDSLEAGLDGDVYELKARPREDMPLIPVRVDGFASLTVSTIRVALGEEFKPQSVALARPAPELKSILQKYQNFFGCPVIFDAPVTTITVAAQDMARTLPAANPELTRMYEQLTVEHLAKIDRSDFPARVHKELIKLLPTGVSGKDLVAQALNMSTRTLYNKLESAGTTYREVLDDTRRGLAEDYISQELPIYEIAYLIGFSDTANFSRAFKKWTGKSPIEFREAQ
ncbi:MAG: AraC family transcriptional regulator [Halieaceae bacterium]